MAAKIVQIEMTDDQVLSLAATIATCCLVALEQHMPAHKAMARKIQDLEKAIMGLANLTGQQLDDKMVDIGTGAWGPAMRWVAKRVQS